MKKALFTVVLFAWVALSAGIAGAVEYTIGIGDILSIRVWGEDALSTDVKVRSDGKISMPGVGDIQADGLTPVQLQGRIAGRLKELVNEPMVTVMVHSSSNDLVIVHGPGVKAGVVLLTGKTTLLQLLSQLSPDHNADLDKAYVSRGEVIVLTGFRGVYEKGDTTGNIQILPGDRVFIPLRPERFVFVDGAVAKPVTLPFYEGMSLLEALHLAGGYTKFADRNETVIVRKRGAGSENITVRGCDLLEKGDMSQNVLLQAGDMVLVKKGWF